MEVRDNVEGSSATERVRRQTNTIPLGEEQRIRESSTDIDSVNKKSMEEDMEIGAIGGENPPHTSEPIVTTNDDTDGDKGVVSILPLKSNQQNKNTEEGEKTGCDTTTANNSKSKLDEEAVRDEADSSTSHDSISFSSSTYLSGNTSFTRKSVSRLDGSLDVNKLMSWSLPKLDTSMLQGNKGGHKNSSFNPAMEASAASTPLLIAKNLEKFKRRKKSTAMEFGSGDERNTMRALMNKLLKKD